MKKFLQRFGVIAVLLIMVILFLYNALSQDSLNAYNSDTGTSVYTVSTEKETEKQIEAVTYHSDTIDFSMEIPAGWEYVLKDGFDTYIHSASASSIQIQILSYYPMVNDVSAESLAQSYDAYGYTLTEFSYLANNMYYDIYQSYISSGVVDYIEWVVWDRQHVVKIVVCFNDGYYEKLQDEIWYSLDSIVWNYEDPIDETYFLNYQLYGDFEFAVPMTWIVASTDDSYYAYDEETGSDLTVYVMEDPMLATDFSQVDFVNYLSAGLDNFMLTQFQQGENYLYGEGTYYTNGIQCVTAQNYITNGTFHYVLTWVMPMDYSEYYLPMARTALELTRVFYTPDEEEEYVYFETEDMTDIEYEEYEDNLFPDETETEFSDSVFVPDMLNGNTETPSVSSDTNEQQDVGTFADALMTVANISSEQAQQIASIWNYNIGTTPVYAAAYMQSNTSLVVYVQDNYETDFYLFISLVTGELQEIRAYSVDGEVAYMQ